MSIVTQGYGGGLVISTTQIGDGSGGAIVVSSRDACPNTNFQLLIDGEEVKFFKTVNINKTLSALATFTINLGNPEGCKTYRFRQNSTVEFKASYGGRTLTTRVLGLIKQRGFTSGGSRELVIAGIDFGDYLLRKKPWDEANKLPIQFVNERTSSILSKLLGRAPELTMRIRKLPGEIKLDYITDPNANTLLDEFKSVAEIAGYEWYIEGNIVIVRPPRDLIAENSVYNLIFGDIDDYSGILPELPFVWLRSSSLDEDGGTIRNVYKVIGADEISSIAKNTSSIQQYNGEFEAQETNEQLTSVQSCYQYAKRLGEVNGQPRRQATVSSRGTDGIDVGDVVSVGDTKGMFDVLDDPYLRVVSINENFGVNGWMMSMQLGSLERRLSDFF